MAKVRTVLGDIESSELGFTMAHEHVFMHKGRVNGPETDWSLWRWEPQVQMCKDFKAIGGGCVVEATPRYWDGRDPAGMAAVSKSTGLHIVACTGGMGTGSWNEKTGKLNDLTEELKNQTKEDRAQFFIKEIEEGMDGTDIKAGWIKGYSHYNYITEGCEKNLRGAAIASIKTGAPVHTHTTTGTYALEQIEIVASEGLPLDHFCAAHMDRNPDYGLHKAILETGAYIIYDGPGKAKYYPDEIRINILRKLVEDGFEKQIMLSNDMGKKSHHTVYGYGPGWNWIKERFIPRLLDEGFSQETVDNFMIHNPARFYSIREH